MVCSLKNQKNERMFQIINRMQIENTKIDCEIESFRGLLFQKSIYTYSIFVYRGMKSNLCNGRKRFGKYNIICTVDRNRIENRFVTSTYILNHKCKYGIICYGLIFENILFLRKQSVYDIQIEPLIESQWAFTRSYTQI